MTAHSAPEQAIDTQAACWLLRQQQGLSPAQHAQLQAWLAANPAHGRALASLQAADTLLTCASPAQRDALRAGLPPLLQPVSAHKPAPQPAQAPRSRQRAPLAAAACLCAVIGGTLAWQQWQQQQPLYQQTFATARGEQRSVTLPDGSQVLLDSASRLQVSLYRQHRDTTLLQGQALFSVAHDRQRPFHVLAGSNRVTVLGTRFSVRQVGRSYQVAVAEGRVRVQQYRDAARAAADNTPLQQAILQAGQQIAGNGQQLQPPVRMQAEAVAPWRAGRLVFDNVPLADVIAEFNRYGDSGLTLQHPASGRLRLTGSFPATAPAQFAAALPAVLPLQVTAQGRGWRISPR